jgi:hypothetical protein
MIINGRFLVRDQPRNFVQVCVSTFPAAGELEARGFVASCESGCVVSSPLSDLEILLNSDGDGGLCRGINVATYWGPLTRSTMNLCGSIGWSSVVSAASQHAQVLLRCHLIC